MLKIQRCLACTIFYGYLSEFAYSVHMCRRRGGWITSLLCPIFILTSDTSRSIYIAISLCLSGRSKSHFACDLFSPSAPLTSSFFPSHFMLSCIFLCRCFDRQDYCSRGWCLDMGWHCTAPWAHAQIREDIRNPSLHVLFNHTGWRGNVFMGLIVEQIHIVFDGVCHLNIFVF